MYNNRTKNFIFTDKTMNKGWVQSNSQGGYKKFSLIDLVRTFPLKPILMMVVGINSSLLTGFLLRRLKADLMGTSDKAFLIIQIVSYSIGALRIIANLFAKAIGMYVSKFFVLKL